MNSLKRQAAKAKRYGELKTELVAQLRVALSGRFRMLERELTKIALDLNVATGEFQKLNTEIGESEKRHTALQEHTYAIEAKLTGGTEATSRVPRRSRARTGPAGITGPPDFIDRRPSQPRRQRDAGTRKAIRAQQLELAQHTERLEEVERVAQESRPRSH